jgi:hypothetical protein
MIDVHFIEFTQKNVGSPCHRIEFNSNHDILAIKYFRTFINHQVAGRACFVAALVGLLCRWNGSLILMSIYYVAALEKNVHGCLF